LTFEAAVVFDETELLERPTQISAVRSSATAQPRMRRSSRVPAYPVPILSIQIAQIADVFPGTRRFVR
jgi:hypothetical protein